MFEPLKEQQGPVIPAAPPACVRFVVTGFGCFNGVSENPTECLVRWLGETLGFPTLLPSGGAPQPLLLLLHSATVLRVAARDVDDWLNEVVQQLGKEDDGEPHAAGDSLEGRDGTRGPQGSDDPHPPPPSYAAFAGSGGGSREAGPDRPAAGRVDLRAATSTAAVAMAVAHPTCTVFLHWGVDAGGGVFKLEAAAYNNATFRVPDERGWQPKGEVIERGGLDDTLCSRLDVEGLCRELRSEVRVHACMRWVGFRVLGF